jgi:putative oxidoreductase
MLTASAPLVFPQLAPLYQTVTPILEALLRVLVAMALVPHGLRLFYGFFPGTGVQVGSFAAFTGVLRKLGYRPAKQCAALVFIAELVAAPMMALGLFTRPAALVVCVLLCLSVYEHIRDGYFWNTLGVEYPNLWALAGLYFLARGGGPYSLDHLLLGWEF